MEQNRLHFYVFRWMFFMLGIFLIGLGIALMVKGALGLSPWDVFHQGVTNVTNWSMGRVMQGTGVVLILISWLLGYRPGLGTIINMWGVGFFFDFILFYLPSPNFFLTRVVFFLLGILVYALGTGAYIASQFGAGPRDSLMMALHQKTGKSIAAMRTSIELFALAIGWFLGGVVGVGTIVFSFSIGPLVSGTIPRAELFLVRIERLFYPSRSKKNPNIT